LNRNLSSCALGNGKVPLRSSDDEEEVVEGAGPVVDRGLLLGHGLEEGGLDLGRSAVDLVGEHDVGEHRARPEEEPVRVGVEDGRARHVRGQEVWRELDPAPGDDVVLGDVVDDGVAERLGQGRLARSGVVLEQDVAVGQQGDDDQLDDVVAAPYRGPEPVAEALEHAVRPLEIADGRRFFVGDVLALFEILFE
jgi:hypothetical protein